MVIAAEENIILDHDFSLSYGDWLRSIISVRFESNFRVFLSFMRHDIRSYVDLHTLDCNRCEDLIG